MTVVLIVGGWIACGIACAGFNFAYFQGKWPTLAAAHYCEDLSLAIGLGLIFGPIGLVCELIHGGLGQYGWRLR